MGFLDQLEKVARGAVDMISAPLGVPIDLIRMIPDRNMTLGRAFGGNFEQFTQGLAGVSQGTGLSYVGGNIAEHTPVDEAISGVLREMELAYNTEFQLDRGQAPMGLRQMGVDPGVASISRVAGAATGIAGAASPAGWLGRERAGQGGLSGYLNGITQSYSNTDPRIKGLSPGEALVLNSMGAVNLPEPELRSLMGNIGFKIMTGASDAIVRWYTQPEVLVGKGLKRARIKWHVRPVANTMRATERKYGIQLRPADQIDQAPVPRKVPESDELIGKIDELIPDEGTVQLPDTPIMDEFIDLAEKYPFLKPLAEKLKTQKAAYQAQFKAHEPFYVLNETLDDLGSTYTEMKAALRGEVAVGRGEVGALNMQIDNPTGQSVYHVTTESQLRNITDSGVLRVPPGADKLYEGSTRLQAFVKRMRQEVPDLIDAEDTHMMIERVTPDEAADLNSAYLAMAERLEGQVPSFDDIRTGQISETMESMPEQLRVWSLLSDSNTNTFIIGDDLEAILNLAANSSERRAIAMSIYAKNVDIVNNGQMGMNTAIGMTDSMRIPATHNRAIYLLGEGELPEAYRYAAALYQQNPLDRPVIIKMNPDGLPVIFDDYTNPMLPDPRSGLPSDASLITRVDKIKPDNITEIIRPAPSEFDPGDLSIVLREGRDTPGYLEPGGRLHERLFNPDGSPIRPENMMDYDEIADQFAGMTEAYNSGGPEAAINFANAARQKRTNTGPILYSQMIMKDKKLQMAINWMDGKDADSILRQFFNEVPGGATISTMLADATTYDLRRQILLAVMGIVDPDTTMLPHVTRARIKALQGTVADMQISPEYRRVKMDLEQGMVDELDQATALKFDELQASVEAQVASLEKVEEIGEWLVKVQKSGGILDRPPRLTRGVRTRENIRSTHWFQESTLARPIRAVVEKRAHRFLNLHNPQGHVQIVRQLEEAKSLGFTPEMISSYRNRYMAATNEAEQLRVVLAMDNEIIDRAARQAGLTNEEILQVMSSANRGKATVQDLLKARRYAPEGHDLVKFYDPTSGEYVEMAMPLVSTQLQNWVPLTDVREVLRTTSAIKRYRARMGSVPREMMDSFINLWKPSVLLRGGWPIRVVSDEQLRILARTGSMIAHLASIEAGDVPAWGFANIFGGGRTGPQRAAAVYGLPISMLTSGSTRAAKTVTRGARRLHLIDEEYYAHLANAGTEKLASSRAPFSGPSHSILQEGAALWGVYEVGIMDHLITHGAGEWTSVAVNHRQYYPAWKRVLQDQLGRDPLVRIFLENMGGSEVRIVRQSPNYTAMRKGIEDVFEAQHGTTFLRSDEVLDPHVIDSIADDLYETFTAMSTDNLGRRIMVDSWELENEIHQILSRRIETFLDGDGIPLYDEGVLGEEIAGRIQYWYEDVIQEAAEFADVRMSGTLHEAYIGRRLDEWFVDTVGPHWMEDEHLVDVYNQIAVRWFASTGDDVEDIITEMRRGFLDKIARHPEVGDIWAVQPEMLPGMSDDFRSMYIDAWRLAKNVEVPTGDTAKSAARKWLNTSEGVEYQSRLPWRSNKIDKWLDDVDEMTRSYTSDYDPGLTRAALDGKVTRSVLESVDEARRPPSVHAEIVEQTLGRSVVMHSVKEFTSTAFDTLGRLPTDTLSRQPFFRQRYADEMTRLSRMVTKQGGELTEDVIQRMNQQARAFALHEVKKWLYDLSETSRFGQMMRWFVPFYPAWQEVLEVWSGLIIRDPSIIGRGMLIWNAPNKLGIVEEDEDGNQFISLRLSEKVTEGMGLEGWAKYISEGGVRFGKNSFNMVTNNPFPSAGPVIQMPVNEVVKNRPDLEEALKFILPYGVKANSLEVMLSPIVKRAGALINSPEGDASYQRDFTQALIWLDWRFRTGESSVPPSYDEAHDIAKKVFALRLFANLTSPAQPIFDSPLKPYMDIYRQMIEEYGPEEADEMFLGQYGAEFFAVTMSRTVSKTGIPPTVEGQAARQRYDSLISRYPDYGRFIIGEDAAIGEFSTAAFAWQLSNSPTADPKFHGESDRDYRNFDLDPDTGMITEVDRRLGWQEYIQAMDLIDLERRGRGLTSLRVKEAEDLNALKQTLTNKIAEEYPEWWRDFNARDDLKWPDRIKAMRDISTAVLRTEDRPDMEGVQDYLEARSLILEELNHRKQMGNSGSLDAKSNIDLMGLWEVLVARILEENIHFLPIYYRYLEGDTVELNSNE